ncbi:AfsR/SARP family transcriptional regulator [Dictyobacter aurantiacus]|uniref:Bacterial transcriptional activator domain-containing protein n=1 Tax=Dictyobacter aurantiacus TaxID=1936993 RepID=A0A401ZDC1_9CHLR|nr:BTAD domain-containing putative transcriptional regulator [Dictyobacter aurantiacus]GCE04880.1 hypothetical protein KDAU_22090 [Dictyobacter aurantiacus]
MVAMVEMAEPVGRPDYPFLRVTTMGDFVLSCVVAQKEGRPRYRAMEGGELGNRRAALAILKFLLCSPRRRATKAEITKALWAGRDPEHANHIFDTAASALRRQILHLPGIDSLLNTRRLNGETHLILATQAWIWVDADALIKLAQMALRQEQQGKDPLHYLEAAHALDKGEFLEEDAGYRWTQGRRQTIEGAKRRVLYHLVEIYCKNKQTTKAEELLYTFLQTYPEDEDALCRLLQLLAQQGRRQEALNVYRYSAEQMQETGKEPGIYTRQIIERLQRGIQVHERSATYGALQSHYIYAIVLVA